MAQRHHRRGGFFIIWGERAVSQKDGKSANAVCPACRKETVILSKFSRRWFTLYFIPVYPISGPVHYCECSGCRNQFNCDITYFQGNQHPAASELGYQKAIALYNELLSDPENSEKLMAVMKVYADMDEWRDAAAAARDFPKALEKSPDCLRFAATVYRKLDNEDYAQRCDAAACLLSGISTERAIAATA